ncbi:hypothetical protein [Frankia sp. Cr1]|uniref:hypothetical protein n=1 Tax=Frankia sp. Cr1 TaxID=3073931 RepID=UPI002AD26BE6|nr:hypothetical protein [Frankia sp. Cr1]
MTDNSDPASGLPAMDPATRRQVQATPRRLAYDYDYDYETCGSPPRAWGRHMHRFPS